MAALSNVLTTNILTHQFLTSSWTKPTTIAVALTTAVSTATGIGTEVSNSNAYARVACNPSTSNWSLSLVSGVETITNVNAITFAVATGSWGTVTSIALTDSATYGSGNLLAFGTLSSSQVISTSNQFIIPAGGLTLSLQ